MIANHQRFATAPPPEISGTAIQARVKEWGAIVQRQIDAAPARQELFRIMWGRMVMLGYIQAFDDPDYPLVLAHDYGCEITA